MEHKHEPSQSLREENLEDKGRLIEELKQEKDF